jgi:hypothetical protein
VSLAGTASGQRVRINDAEVFTPEQRNRIYTIAEVVGAGADAFVSLKASDGTICEWFRVAELDPPFDTPLMPQAPAPTRAIGKLEKRTDRVVIGKPSPVASGPYEASADHAAGIAAAAASLSAEHHVSLRDAMDAIARCRPDLVARYHEGMDAGPRDRTADTWSLSDQQSAESREAARDAAVAKLQAIAARIQAAEGCSASEALVKASLEDVVSAEVYRSRKGGL